MNYPAPLDAQIATDWPIVDEYRKVYAEVRMLRLAADRARAAAEKAVTGAPRPTRRAARLFARYEDLIERLPLAEYGLWELHGQALRMGPEVHAALEGARRTVEELAAHRAAAREADLEARMNEFLGY